MSGPTTRAFRPAADVERPGAVLALAAGRATTPLWRNQFGGLTFSIDGDPPVVVKWDPAGSGESLGAEAERMAWLAGRFPAPVPEASGADADGEWLATRAIAGRSAVDPRWLGDPATAVRAIATGLRRLHDGLDASTCPFSWSVADRLAVLRDGGVEVPDALRAPPPIDRLVVCHGDPCAPNSLVDDAGRFAAIVDVGRLGVADRWADLAVASMSLDWNYGEGWQSAFFAAYGIAPDALRIEYYRALWNAG